MKCVFSLSRYDSGDHVAVYPVNDSALVNRLLELTNEDPDIVFSLANVDEDSSKKHPFPCPCTYRTALSHYVDITALPRTHILKELAEYTSDPAVSSYWMCKYLTVCYRQCIKLL